MSEATLESSLRKLRHQLHRKPQLSGDESATIDILKQWCKEHLSNWEVSMIANDKSLLLSKRFSSQNTSLLFRAELDALPIQEDVQLSYRSQHADISHKCGHDGHMTILMGLAASLDQNDGGVGKIFLLFQHAEETGEGGAEVKDYFQKSDLAFDAVFALHNVPGFGVGDLVCKPGHFSMASTGLILEFEGRTAHAAEPDKAHSPLPILQHLIQDFQFVDRNTEETRIATIVGIDFGGRNFGVSPANMGIYLTLRASTDQILESMIDEILVKVQSEKVIERLAFSSKLTETFPACINNPGMYEVVINAANSLGTNIVELDAPFPWSEDFGHILSTYPGCIFGIGAGLDSEPLHHPSYDFPDAIIMPSIHLFSQIIRQFEK
jgi:amidohydrolase